ncbi:MT0933-like antitoxin protein [Actinacidiphila alni]|uniref:MT0933-like antitoxin protein n=1 Tax=Actinacidiphila alni TaxID=380248 RepID=A0A1I2LJH9_9ACTN|nr:antitoxin [Actinacidiphila alni]SFF77216.1 MT0933-like antitoxin protein [Actinacidiphila alni]
MGKFGDLVNKAKEAAKDHPDQVDKAADRGQDFAQDRTGHKYDDQIDRGVDSVQKAYGGDADDPARDA